MNRETFDARRLTTRADFDAQRAREAAAKIALEAAAKIARPPFVLISAERVGLAADANEARTRKLFEDLEDADFVAHDVIGVWQGVRERSFLVPLDADRYVQNHLATLATIAARYQQDAILYVQWNGRATLISNAADSSTDVDIGVWGPYVVADDTRPIGERGYTEINGVPYAAV